MATKQSKQVQSGYPLPTALDAVGTLTIVAEYVVPAAGAAVGDVIEMGGLPKDVIPLDMTVHNSAGAASSTVAFGLLTGTYGSLDGSRTCGAEFIAAYGVTAAGINRMGKAVTTYSKTDDTTGWGFVVAGAALQAGQIIRAALFCIPAPAGIA